MLKNWTRSEIIINNKYIIQLQRASNWLTHLTYRDDLKLHNELRVPYIACEIMSVGRDQGSSDGLTSDTC